VSMRVTQSAITASMLAGLQNNQARMGALQQQLSSGKQILKPSDDPVGTDQAMRYRAEIARNTQYQRNAQDGQSWLGTADNALQGGVAILQRLQTLVTQAANTGSGDQTARDTIAVEVSNLKQEMLSVANTSYQGRPIFGGTTPNSAAYVQDPNTGVVTYQGDNGAVTRTVGLNAQVKVNVDASQAFGAGATDVFAMFDKINSDLASNPNGLSGDLANIQTSMHNLMNAEATEGSAYNRITSMTNTSTALVGTLTDNLSGVENIDIAKTVTDLTMQQVSYQASLSAMSNVLQLSLTQFLK
jgi:flagellar hook-associated protein 3 FlgL